MFASQIVPPLPTAVCKAIDSGYSCFPVGLNKRPLFQWRVYQERRPLVGELQTWAERSNSAWAVVTGAVSGIVILDFDGPQGMELAQRWGIDPHIRTGSGGLHWYVKHPGHPVKTLNSKSDKARLGAHFPGLDIRADGGFAIFWSARPLRGDAGAGLQHWEHKHCYQLLRDFEPDPIELVPEDARRILGLNPPPPPRPPAPRTQTTTTTTGAPETAGEFVARMMATALDRARSDGRNNAGAWLAAQLRDAGLSESEAEAAILDYQRSTGETDQHGQRAPYTADEARRTLRSIYARPRREPARSARSRARGPFVPPAEPTRRPAEVRDNGEAEPKPGPGRPPSKSPAECPRTDLGNAERLIIRYGRDLKFCHPLKEWLIWNGSRWEPDTTGQIMRLAYDTVRQIHQEGGEDAGKWALKSQDHSRINALVSLARNWQHIAVDPNSLDQNAYLFNCSNGTLNLKTGELRKAQREDLITKLSPVSYDPEAEWPAFHRFVDSLMLGREDLCRYLQRIFGYALTGAVTEKAVFVAHGHGDNGKTTLLEAFRYIMGDYAVALRIESLMQAQRPAAGNEANPDIVHLRGARYVTTSEAEDGQRLNESLVKLLTGMNRISARGLYRDQFEFDPSHKLFLDSNYRPKVRGQDKGIWTRLKLIPFDLHLTDDKKDRSLGEKLRNEAAGILRWAVYGCLDWQQDGLEEPAEVRAATAEYRASMDTLGMFIEECCLIDEDATQQARPLYTAYAAWVKAAGEFVMSEKSFSERLQDRGIRKVRKTAGMTYEGLCLKVNVDSSGNLTPLSVFQDAM